MKPVLYRYKDTESVIKVMDGYTPGEGWEPLYSQDQISSAVNAALKATAPDERVKELEAELAAAEIAIAEYRQQCLDNAAEIARLRSESEERLQNCAALDRPDARPHRYGVQGNDAWNHYGTRGQAMTTREAFEDWYEVDCYPCEHSNWFRLDSDGDYEFDEVQYAWRTWQAVTASALERAIQACKKVADKQSTLGRQFAAIECADAIRALKESKE